MNESGLAPPQLPSVFRPRAKADRVPVLPAGLSVADLQAKLDNYYFHHSIDFGGGLVSKSRADHRFIEQTAEALFGAFDLRDRSMLDVGAWTGAYSFEAKWCGAGRVVATDQYVWTNPVFRGREAFDLALSLTGLDIEARQIDVPDITPSSVGLFDVVLFAGVFYHLFDAVHLTRQISRCARHLLIVETHLDALDDERPAMIFYPGDTLNGDGSNWWGPNPHCVYELLGECGFAEIWYCGAPAIRNRGIFHAFRDEESRQVMDWQADDRWQRLSDPAVARRDFAPTPTAV